MIEIENEKNRNLKNVKQVGTPRENNKIVLNTDFSAIAKMLGIGRASLYRAFEK